VHCAGDSFVCGIRFALWYTVYAVFKEFVSVPYNALGTELTQDDKERKSLYTCVAAGCSWWWCNPSHAPSMFPYLEPLASLSLFRVCCGASKTTQPACAFVSCFSLLQLMNVCGLLLGTAMNLLLTTFITIVAGGALSLIGYVVRWVDGRFVS